MLRKRKGNDDTAVAPKRGRVDDEDEALKSLLGLYGPWTDVFGMHWRTVAEVARNSAQLTVSVRAERPKGFETLTGECVSRVLGHKAFGSFMVSEVVVDFGLREVRFTLVREARETTTSTAAPPPWQKTPQEGVMMISDQKVVRGEWLRDALSLAGDARLVAIHFDKKTIRVQTALR